MSGLLVMALAVAGGTIFYVRQNNISSNLTLTEDVEAGRPGQQGAGMGRFDSGFRQELVVSGLTGMGTIQEKLAVEDLTDILYVEEVYISSEDEVKEGDPVLKLSEESVELARETLADALRAAELAYRAGTIEYEQSKITAEYERDMAVLTGEQAQEVYEAEVAGLVSALEQAEEKLSDAQKQIQEYQELIDSGNYNAYYHVEEYKALYDENLKLLTARMEEWGADWTQVVGGSTAGQGSTVTGSIVMTEDSVSGGDAGGVSDTQAAAGQEAAGAPTADQLQVLKSLYNVLEQNLKDYEQALEAAEDASSNAILELQTLQLSLSSLEKSLAEAQSDYDTQLLRAKLTLESSLAEAERADSNYETAMEKAQADYEALQDTWEDAKENLALFESSLGDGYYRAAGSGIILKSMVRAGQYLNSDSTVFIYSNPEEMTVTVSVSQEDIAGIDVGNRVIVMRSEGGTLQGTVTKINPIATSGSRTSVTYQVTAALTGETGGLEANETVTVLIGTGGSLDEKEN